MFDRVAKAVVGGAVAFVSALVPILEDGVITSAELGVLVGAVLGGYTFVWAVPRQVLGDVAKAVMGAVGAGGSAFLAVYADGSMSGSDWYYVLAAVVGGIAVYQQGNAPQPQ